MAQAKNSATLWDGFWQRKAVDLEEDRYDLEKAANSVRWRRMDAHVRAKFGSFQGLEVIEIGAGRGTNAALMARAGAKVSVLDYSDAALAAAKEFFERNSVEACYIRADALKIEEQGLLSKFDVSMSFGLAEHFLDDSRRKIISAHFEVLKPKGLTFISVPNSWNPPYRLYKFAAERVGRWGVGEEYPFSRFEFARICHGLGCKDFDFFGDSFVDSFRFVNPLKILPKLLNRAPGRAPIRRERGTPLDAYFAYALVLVGYKLALD